MAMTGATGRGAPGGRRSAVAGRGASDGREGVQEHPGAQRHHRRRVHGHDGHVRRGDDEGLYGVSRAGDSLRQPRRVCDDDADDSARAADDRHDEHHQPHVLRQSAAGDLLHLPQRDVVAAARAESRRFSTGRRRPTTPIASSSSPCPTARTRSTASSRATCRRSAAPQRWAAVNSLAASGTYAGWDTSRVEVPVELFGRAPNQFTTIVHRKEGDNVFVFNGLQRLVCGRGCRRAELHAAVHRRQPHRRTDRCARSDRSPHDSEGLLAVAGQRGRGGRRARDGAAGHQSGRDAGEPLLRRRGPAGASGPVERHGRRARADAVRLFGLPRGRGRPEAVRSGCGRGPTTGSSSS